MYQLWAAAAWSSLYWLPSIAAPTLVIAGESDPLVPPGNAQILARLLPRARRHLVAGGGHLCLLERAGELAPIINGFLAETAPHH
jgi:pimeloyl-ACP methyl ester carboxylesterase